MNEDKKCCGGGCHDDVMGDFSHAQEEDRNLLDDAKYVGYDALLAVLEDKVIEKLEQMDIPAIDTIADDIAKSIAKNLSGEGMTDAEESEM